MQSCWGVANFCARRYASVVGQIGRQDVVWKTGELGRQATGNCSLQFGETTVLATVVCGTVRQAFLEKVVLKVDYKARASATGRFPTGLSRREIHATEREIGAGWQLEAALRPLFPRFFGLDVSISTTVMSADVHSPDPEIVAINAASGALMCSDVPWYGPVGACEVALVGKELVPHPSRHVLREAAMSLKFAGTRNRVLMLQAWGKRVGFVEVEKALEVAQRECQALIDGQWQLAAEVKEPKRQVLCLGTDPIAAARIDEAALPLFEEVYSAARDRKSRSALVEEVRRKVQKILEDQGAMRSVLTRLPGSGCVSQNDLAVALGMAEDNVLRRHILQEGRRPDGRLSHDLRPLSSRVHSVRLSELTVLSGSFEQGDTEVLSTATVETGRYLQAMRESTVGWGRLEQELSQLVVDYFHPDYADNQITLHQRLSRRDRAHAIFLREALNGGLRFGQDFPFPVCITADVTGSDGSSPTAAVCGSSLAMKDAGIPLVELTAGVTMGLITDGANNGFEHEVGGDLYQEHVESQSDCVQSVILTDPQSVEEFYGDMDLKVTATVAGFTGLSMSTKLPGGVQIPTIKAALQQSQNALSQILSSMSSTASAKPAERQARLDRLDVDPQFLGAIIGKEGSSIQKLGQETGAQICIEQTGTVHLYAPSVPQMEKAKHWILAQQGLTIHEGEVYSAKVVRILDHGAFVELPNGFHVLLHISELSHQTVSSVKDVLMEGEVLDVKCIGRDMFGNIFVSRKALDG